MVETIAKKSCVGSHEVAQYYPTQPCGTTLCTHSDTHCSCDSSSTLRFDLQEIIRGENDYLFGHENVVHGRELYRASFLLGSGRTPHLCRLHLFGVP